MKVFARYSLNNVLLLTAQKMKLFLKGFFCKCDQIRSFLQIWSYLLKKFVIGKFIFWAVYCSVSYCPEEKGVRKISQNSQENAYARASLLINFNKKETLAQVFSCEFREILKNIFFIEHFCWLLLTLRTLKITPVTLVTWGSLMNAKFLILFSLINEVNWAFVLMVWESKWGLIWWIKTVHLISSSSCCCF